MFHLLSFDIVPWLGKRVIERTCEKLSPLLVSALVNRRAMDTE